jgi:hypothetical protein
MGLIEAPDAAKPRQLESGDDDDAESDNVAEASGGIAEGADGIAKASDDAGARPAKPEEPVIHEAQLLEEFDKLEKSD